MSSFQKLWENIKKNKINENSDIDEKSIDVIKSGLNIDESFWENFLLILNNGEGLANLLDVPYEKVITWNDKIKKALDQTKDNIETPEKKNDKIMKTGLPNQDPQEEDENEEI